jgi:RNA polymerase sporulation-specific sigma factor
MIIKRFLFKIRAFFLRLFSAKVYYINGTDTLPPPLEEEVEEHLLEHIDSQQSRDMLIEHNLRLVVYIAKRFENTGVGIEELVSIGTVGLIKAISTFNSDKNIKLATYASRCIENEILMFLRKTSKIKGEISLDEPLNVDYEGNELLLSDILGTDTEIVYKSLEDKAEKGILRKALDKLSKRERTIIDLRYGLDGSDEMTQKEVADLLGISQSYISRLEKKIVKRLKKEFRKFV